MNGERTGKEKDREGCGRSIGVSDMATGVSDMHVHRGV